MRALLSKDVYSFAHVKGGAHFKTHMAYLQQHPSKPRVTMMDYTRGNPSISVQLADEEWVEDRDHWQDVNETRRWMVPERSNSSVMHDGLIRIAKEIPPDSDATEDIRELLEANESVITIH
ncbi:hypothetical protein C8R44DRAFT_863121 [Mycena epipterygia]|nr:hypothetical protein C8R44DRAFT_863121 [Mycena epipterygia]